jgi:hypothetical protein
MKRSLRRVAEVAVRGLYSRPERARLFVTASQYLQGHPKSGFLYGLYKQAFVVLGMSLRRPGNKRARSRMLWAGNATRYIYRGWWAPCVVA